MWEIALRFRSKPRDRTPNNTTSLGRQADAFSGLSNRQRTVIDRNLGAIDIQDLDE